MAGKRDKKQIRDILSLIEQFDADVAEIASQKEQRQADAAEAMASLRERSSPVSFAGWTSKTSTGKSWESVWRPLRAAGIENMEQLCSLTADQINAVKGIGDEAAWLIYTMAGRIRGGGDRAEAAAEPGGQKTRTRRSPACGKRAMLTDATVREAQELYNGIMRPWRRRIRTQSPPRAASAGCFCRRRRSGAPWTRRSISMSCSPGEYGERVRALLKSYDALVIPDENSVWEDFKRNSPAYFARLDEFARALNTRIDNSYSGLPEELVRAVEMEPIYVDTLHTALRGYQEFGVRYILRQGSVLLGDEMGLGKTVQAIAAMVSLSALGATHFMVVCPASVLVNWTREIKAFSDLTVTVIRGGDQMAALRWMENGGAAVTTYESISRFALPEEFRFSLLIADEAHYVKNPAARRTQALLLLRRKAERLLFMTGTPLENRVDEMCFLVSCLRADIAGELRKMKYISSAPQFREKLAPVYLRRTRENVLQELPELIEEEQWCELGAEEWRQYLLSVSAENFMAMRQVSWDVGDLKKSSKARRLAELCEEAAEDGRKVIVFSYFRETIRAVCSLLGRRALDPITGDVSPAKRQAIVDEFTAAEDGKVLVCQVQAGGNGTQYPGGKRHPLLRAADQALRREAGHLPRLPHGTASFRSGVPPARRQHGR